MKRILYFCLLMLLTALACDLPGTIPSTPIPTFDDNLISTMVIQTAEALTPSATATNTSIPSETPAPSATTSPTKSARHYDVGEAVAYIPPADYVSPVDVPVAANTVPPSPTSIFISTTGPYIPVVFTLTVTTTPTITPTGTAVVITCAETDKSFEIRVIELINEERAKAGLSALKPQHQLTAAAQVYSADMACHNYLSHTGRDGSRFVERAARQGYQFDYGGENLAGGYATPEEVVQGWMDSPGHRENILNEHYVDVGVGYAFYLYSRYFAYWAAEFGSSK